MSDCTERHPAAPSGGQGMSDCTERHPAAPSDGLAGEGQERMPTGGTA